MNWNRPIGCGVRSLLAIVILAAPVWAQHGGDDGGHMDNDGHGTSNMMDHMGQMHSGEMMEQMSMMMDHMTQMVEEMHGFHEQIASSWSEEMMMDGDHSMPAMMEISEEMQSMEPHMEQMLEHLQGWIDQVPEHDMNDMSDPMNELISHMNAMIEAGRNVMGSIGTMTSTHSTSTNEADHSAMGH